MRRNTFRRWYISVYPSMMSSEASKEWLCICRYRDFLRILHPVLVVTDIYNMVEQTDILRNLHIDCLNPMQQAVVDAYHREGDLIILSPTGTGKTLAFLLPLIQSLKHDCLEVQAIVLTPSRELALQIDSVVKKSNIPFKSLSCYGGKPTMEEHRVMKNIHPSLIIGTPGRINDHLNKQNISHETVRTLIIDEFDKCLEQGFLEEMQSIISQLPALSKRVLLSATDSLDIPLFLGIGKEKRNVVKLDFLSHENRLAERLSIQRVLSPQKDKLDTLYNLLCSLGASTSLVFVNYRESVERVANYLKSKIVSCEAFHGGMEQIDRERALYKFRNRSCTVLISTDLASRGLDIAGVDNVIHYHLPSTMEVFTHRNGRTARWQAGGKSFLILRADETLPSYLKEDFPCFVWPEKIPLPVKPQWSTLYIGKGKKNKLNKVDVVGFLYKKGRLSKEDIGLVDVHDHYSFVAIRRNKMKNMLALVQNEKIKGMKTLIEEAY